MQIPILDPIRAITGFHIYFLCLSSTGETNLVFLPFAHYEGAALSDPILLPVPLHVLPHPDDLFPIFFVSRHPNQR